MTLNKNNLSDDDISMRIVGGNITTTYKYPWYAMLVRIVNKKSAFECGGSIINSLYVLTAAHCKKVSTVQKLKATLLIGTEYIL